MNKKEYPYISTYKLVLKLGCGAPVDPQFFNFIRYLGIGHAQRFCLCD